MAHEVASSGMPSASGAAPAAATHVLTSRPLLRHIMDFVDGVPGSVVALVTEYEHKRSAMPWSVSGALPRAAIQRGDLWTLRALRRLSATQRYQARPELAFHEATRCAVQFGRLEILRWLADTGMLLSDNEEAGPAGSLTMNKMASTLVGWAARYSEALASSSKLEIVAWVCDAFPSSELRDVNVKDLSHASVSVLRFLHERGLCNGEFGDPRLADCIATMGRMDTLRFLLDQEAGEGRPATGKCTSDAMDGAATNGHLEVVEYLHSHRTEGCTTTAMDGAARNGHVEIVRFLQTHRTEGCTSAAMDEAARYGHLEVVRFLHEENTGACTTRAMDGAAAGGFLEVVRFLNDHRSEGCTKKAMDSAARGGHLRVVRYLDDQRDEGCTTDAMDGAALVGCLPVVRFLHAHRREGCTTRAVDGAAWRGHIEVVRFLMARRFEGCTARAMDSACQNGHLETVRFLDEHGAATCTVNAMDNAASGGHLELVRYLHTHRIEGCTHEAMTKAAMNGHAAVVLFLAENRREGVHAYALERTAAKGYADCVDTLCRYSTRGCLLEARRVALQAGHPEVAMLLSSWINPEIRVCSACHHLQPGSRWCQKPRPRQVEVAQDDAPSLGGQNGDNKPSSASGLFRWWWFRWL